MRGSVSGAMESFLESIQIEDYSTDSEITLQAVKPQRPWGVTGSAVRFTVYASPDQISKFQAQTSNGSIKVETEFQGSLNLTTSNGPIVLRSGRGSISLRTSNGRIELGEIYLTIPALPKHRMAVLRVQWYYPVMAITYLRHRTAALFRDATRYGR